MTQIETQVYFDNLVDYLVGCTDVWHKHELVAYGLLETSSQPNERHVSRHEVEGALHCRRLYVQIQPCCKGQYRVGEEGIPGHSAN